MQSSSRITEKALDSIRQAILEADGNEVMFCGNLNDEGRIETVIIAARGNEESVPAIEAFVEKGDTVIHNHPDGFLKPSSADLRIASILGTQGIGFIIIDNKAENIYVVAEPVISKKRKRIDTELLAGALSPGGSMSKIFEYYETRESQIEMLKAVAECFNNENMTVAEAGTGVGKSLAYLLPSFQWVTDNEERIVISTNTINLQHQLLEKDIPLVKKILDTDKKAALIKGRSNYLCLKKYYEAINENSLFENDNAGLNIIREWAPATETGDKADLPVMPDYAIWNDVCSESDYCLGLYCPYREKCFVIKARKNAASASVLVVNHHLLFSDLSARSSGAGFNGTAVLPVFKHLIFDEAHNIEAAATSYFSMVLSKGYVIKTFRKLYSRFRGKIFGIYRFIEANAGVHEKKVGELPQLISDTLVLYETLEREAQLLLESGGQNIKIEKSPLFDNLFSALISFKKNISAVYLLLDEISHNIDLSADDDSRVYELVLIKSKLKTLISTSEILLDLNEDYVSWIEKGKNISFILTPLDVGKVLKETVYEKINSIVFTSATLSIRKSFDYWENRIGLSSFKERIVEKHFKSPFDYARHVLLAVPSDIKDPSDHLYVNELSDFVTRLIILAEGGVLVLFTSYSMLKDVYANIKDKVTESGITLLRQGDFDRYKIQKVFNEDKKSVLLATDSFWEGIDSPGETLKMVIICRLPFKVPTDPVTKSRLDKIEREGGNPFTDYSLPEAVIKLKQGFGRLMRRKTDSGIVIITDNRVIKKTYGHLFLSSLPETVTCFSEKTEIEKKAEDFLYSKKK